MIGLSSAVALREAGHEVTIVSATRSGGGVSARAGAIFTPFAGACVEITRASYTAFEKLASERPQSGVRMALTREYFFDKEKPIAPWGVGMKSVLVLPPPAPYKSAWESLRPHMDMTRYLPWLEGRFERELGGKIQERSLSPGDIPRMAREFDRVVVCAGLGARELATDPCVRPMRGQVMHVPNTLGLKDSLEGSGDGTVTYVFPFDGHVVLGGTYEPDVAEDATDERTLAAILERCRALLRTDGHPRWKELSGERLRAWAGLRPARIVGGNAETVRLEVDSENPRVIHNYGHGRAGVSLSWGCAAEVVRLVG